MTRKIAAFLTLVILLGACRATAPVPAVKTPAAVAPAEIPTLQATPFPDELTAWMDESIDIDAFEPDSPIVIHFSRPMDPDSAAAPLVFVPRLLGEFTWNADTTILTFTPSSNMNPAVEYQVLIARMLATVEGETFTARPSWFLGLASTPRIVVRSPSGVRLEDGVRSFSITFSHQLDEASFEAALSVDPEVPLNFSWSPKVVQVILDTVFSSDQLYKFVLDGTAVTLEGLAIEATTWTYRTPVAAVAFERAEEPSRLAPLRFVFNYPMDPETLDGAVSLDPSVALESAWDAATKTLTVTPLEPLLASRFYQVTLSSSIATNSGGSPFEEPQTWSFATGATVTSFSGTSTAGREATILLQAGIALDTASVAAALRIEPEVAHSVSWSPDRTRLTVRIEETLPSLTMYTFHFAGEVLDADGFPLGNLGVFRYETPGPVKGLDLAYGTDFLYHDPGRPLRIEFDREMDPNSALAALTIVPAVEASYIWESRSALVISPDSGYFGEYTQYRFTLEVSAVDSAGDQVVQEPYSWTVGTDGLPNHAGFGEGGSNVQVVDLDGRRVVHIGVRTNPQTVHLELHRLTIEQFIGLDINAFRVPWAWSRDQKASYDLAGTAPTASWDSEVVVLEDAGEITLPADLPEGLYVLSMYTEYLDDQLLLIASRSTVAVKFAPHPNGGGQLTAWVSNIVDFIMPGADVRVYDNAGRQIAAGITDSDGIFQTLLPTNSRPYLVVARRDGGITASGISSIWHTRGYAGPDIQRAATSHEYLAYTYTDRPIYRPGQTVYYKIVVRSDNDAVYRLPPADFTAILNVRDARNNLLDVVPIAVNEFGTYNGAFDVADGAMLGDYKLELVIGSETHTQYFKVEDYTKPDVAVTVTADRGDYLAGDEIILTINTDYLFGEPVSGAQIQLNQYELLPEFYYWWLGSPPDSDAEYRWVPTRLAQISGNTDADGVVQFKLNAAMGEVTTGLYYEDSVRTVWGFEVTANDGSNQAVTGFVVVRVYRHSIELYLEKGGFVYEPGSLIPIRGGASSRFGEDVSGRMLTLVLENWNSTSHDMVLFDEVSVTTDQNGSFHTTLELPSGYYQVTLKGEDPAGNVLEQTRYLYVHDFTGTWVVDYTSEIELFVEERDYRPGETASLLIESSQAGEALLTIERGSVLGTRMIRLEAGINRVNIPIVEAHAPNIYAAVQMWMPLDTDIMTAGGDYGIYESIPDAILRWDVVRISVPDVAHALNVEITPDRDLYAPREEATFEIRVTDAGGNPVRAELSLALVDEAIFLLADDPSGDIHDGFYTTRPWGVAMFDSLAPWRYLWIGGQGGGGGEELLHHPRSEFPDTAMWIPSIVTDAGGAASVSVTLPDTLTSWRLTAKAVTTDSLIGQGGANIVTQQEIVIRPIPVHVLTAGDSFVLSAMIHNFGSEGQEITVDVQGDGFEIDDSGPDSIVLAPGEARIVSWNAAAVDPGEAEFTISAIAENGAGDAIQLHFPIRPLSIPIVHVESGSFTGAQTVIVEKPADALPDSEVLIRVDASLAGSMLLGVEYLTGYPYGCVEQTMSRALPNAVVARAFEQLGLEDRGVLAGLDGKIEASVQRLYAFQHIDGGWGWWFDDVSDGYQTAWVVFGLTVTAESGYRIDESVIERGVEYLKSNLDQMNAPTRVFALYSMTVAGYGDLDLAFDQSAYLGELDRFSRAALALTFHELGETAIARQMLEEILQEMVVDGSGQIYAPDAQGDGYYDRKFMSSGIRTTAMILKALVAIEPDSDYREGLVDWLLSRRDRFGWGTTNETAFTLIALTDHMVDRRSEALDAEIGVHLAGTLVYSGTLSAEQGGLAVSIPVSDLVDGSNEIRLESSIQDPLYYSISSRMNIGEAEIAAAGIRVSRRYIDPETLEPITGAEAGDLVIVQLTVEVPEAAFYIMLEDFLPGGLEALNEALNHTGHSEQWTADDYYYSYEEIFLFDQLGYNYKEVRSDRVVFFVTELRAGTRVFQYVARATLTGEFTVLPTQLSAMYDPEFWGRSASAAFIVTGEETAGYVWMWGFRPE